MTTTDSNVPEMLRCSSGRCRCLRPREMFLGPAGTVFKTCSRCRELSPRRTLDGRLRSDYKLTLEEYERMLADQDGVCAICGRPPKPGQRLAVDHDHACCDDRRSCGDCTRALLCTSCNAAIANFRDDPEVMRRAAEYVEGFSVL